MMALPALVRLDSMPRCGGAGTGEITEWTGLRE